MMAKVSRVSKRLVVRRMRFLLVIAIISVSYFMYILTSYFKLPQIRIEGSGSIPSAAVGRANDFIGSQRGKDIVMPNFSWRDLIKRISEGGARSKDEIILRSYGNTEVVVSGVNGYAILILGERNWEVYNVTKYRDLEHRLNHFNNPIQYEDFGRDGFKLKFPR